jgi:hypothetical protein
MLTGVLVLLTSVLAVAGTASAEVKSVTANGFEVGTTGTIAAPADRVYAALGEVGHWWDLSHTFSRDAGNRSIELRAGGCFYERLKDGGSVQHLLVVYAAPGQGLRLRGALGPLQTEGVDGTLSWTLKAGEGGTTITLSYVVGGYLRSSMGQWAPRVDRVLDEQLQRLKVFVEGNPRRNSISQRSGEAVRRDSLRAKLAFGSSHRLTASLFTSLDPPYRARRLCDSLTRRGIRRGETRDGEEIWRRVRGWALPADAPPVRPVDKASAEKIPG